MHLTIYESLEEHMTSGEYVPASLLKLSIKNLYNNF